MSQRLRSAIDCMVDDGFFGYIDEMIDKIEEAFLDGEVLFDYYEVTKKDDGIFDCVGFKLDGSSDIERKGKRVATIRVYRYHSFLKNSEVLEFGLSLDIEGFTDAVYMDYPTDPYFLDNDYRFS